MSIDSGGRIYCDEYRARIQEQLQEITDFVKAPQELKDADQLEALEDKVRQLTDRLGGLVVGHHLQQTLSSDALQREETALIEAWPKRLRREGQVKVRIRTRQGLSCEVQARYCRQKGDGRTKRGVGLYPGLAVLGIQDRCTPGLASEVSQLSAILGSLEEPPLSAKMRPGQSGIMIIDLGAEVSIEWQHIQKSLSVRCWRE